MSMSGLPIEEIYVGFEVFTGVVIKSIIFWDITPCISSTRKMEVMRSSETSVDTQRTTQRHIPEDGTLHDHRSVNLKSYMFLMVQNVLMFIGGF
jgi:hypothetical protein